MKTTRLYDKATGRWMKYTPTWKGIPVSPLQIGDYLLCDVKYADVEGYRIYFKPYSEECEESTGMKGEYVLVMPNDEPYTYYTDLKSALYDLYILKDRE